MENKDILVAGEILVNSEGYKNLTVLCDDYGSRFYATNEEKEAAEFLVKKMEEYGLQNAGIEPTAHFGWKKGQLESLWSWERGEAFFQIVSPISRVLPCISMANAPSTPEGGVSGDIFVLEEGTRDYIIKNKERLRGKIVLIDTYYPPGKYSDVKYLPHSRTTIYGYLVEFGAAAMIWPNIDYGGLPKTGAVRFGFIGEIPAIGISRETSDFILRTLEKNKVKSLLKIKNYYEQNAITHNIVGDLVGNKSPEKVILVGGHYDGHDTAQGAMDDAAGACVVLETARSLAKHGKSFKKTIRFCLFSAEEMGLIGSTGYVLSHKDDIKNIEFMINTDAAGISAKTGHGFSVCGFKELIDYLEQVSGQIGSFDRQWEFPIATEKLSAYSDHFPFFMNGIPSARFHDLPADPIDMKYSHTSVDTVDKVDSKGIKDAAIILALTLSKLADSEDPPPPHISFERIKEILDEKDITENLKIEKRWMREISNY